MGSRCRHAERSRASRIESPQAGVDLDDFRQQVPELLIVIDLVEARVHMMGHLGLLARQRQPRRLTLAQEVTAVGGIEDDTAVAQVLPKQCGLSLPQGRQLVVIIRTK